MIWQDIMIERVASAFEIREAIVRAGLAPNIDAVAVVASMESVKLSPDAKVICELTPRGGGFPLQLTIYVYGGLPKDTLDAIKRLSATLATRCLVPAETENPYAMLLVAPDSEVESVVVDVEALDERGEYVLGT